MWEALQPWAIMAGTTFLASFIPLACNEVRSSEWYKGQNIIVRKLIDFFGVLLMNKFLPSIVLRKDIAIALEEPVKELAPTATKLRDSNFGKIPSQDRDMLTKAAVEDAAITLKTNNPSITKKVSAWELERLITKEVPKVVKKQKRNRMRNGGH